MGWEMGRRFKREGTRVYLWLICVDVWHKPTHQLKKKVTELSLVSDPQGAWVEAVATVTVLYQPPARTHFPLASISEQSEPPQLWSLSFRVRELFRRVKSPSKEKWLLRDRFHLVISFSLSFCPVLSWFLHPLISHFPFSGYTSLIFKTCVFF